MKPRRLPSGAWNCRVMIDGQSYSFTHADKKTVVRMASDFADEYRRKMDNPTLLERMREYVAENEERLSPSTVRSYNGMIRMIEERTPRIANKRLSAITEQDVSDIVRPLRTLKTKRNYVNFISTYHVGGLWRSASWRNLRSPHVRHRRGLRACQQGGRP